jgi:hypothetical protein
VNPANRAEWQSSLARVEQVTGAPRVGQRWVDVTKPGPRPAMETTELVRPHRWTERGTWRGVEAVLTLEFAPAPGGGCEVGYSMNLSGPGALGLPMRVLGRLAPRAVRGDLRTAARILEERSAQTSG